MNKVAMMVVLGLAMTACGRKYGDNTPGACSASNIPAMVQTYKVGAKSFYFSSSNSCTFSASDSNSDAGGGCSIQGVYTDNSNSDNVGQVVMNVVSSTCNGVTPGTFTDTYVISNGAGQISQ